MPSQEEGIDELLRDALYIGINYLDFWNMSVNEIQDCIEIYNKKTVDRLKQETELLYTQSMLTGLVANPMVKQKHIPTLNELFPSLHKSEKKYDYQKEKAGFLNFAYAFNNKNQSEDR